MIGQSGDAAAAVILKLVRHPLQHGGLGIARSLGRLGIPVHTAYVDRVSPAALSRYVVRRHRVVAGADDRMVEQLAAIACQVGGRPVLIAADDLATLFVDRRRGPLGECFRLPDQPAGLPRQLADKGALHRLCTEHDVPAPDTRFPTDVGEAVEAAADLGYPVVAKSMDPAVLRERPNARSVAIARDEDELRAIHAASEVPGAPNLMLQEYIPGGPQQVWMFNGYVDHTGGMPIAMTGIKLRQLPPATGSTTLGITIPNDDVLALTRRFLGAIGYRGMVDMGYRYDARDGRYKLLDVNPRIGATFRLFVARNGLDVVRAQYLDLTGRHVPVGAPPDARRWVVENADLATAITLARRGELGFGAWVRSFRGVQEGAWFSARDPLPMAAMVALAWRSAARRALGTGGRGDSATRARDRGSRSGGRTKALRN